MEQIEASDKVVFSNGTQLETFFTTAPDPGFQGVRKCRVYIQVGEYIIHIHSSNSYQSAQATYERYRPNNKEGVLYA